MIKKIEDQLKALCQDVGLQYSSRPVTGKTSTLRDAQGQLQIITTRKMRGGYPAEFDAPFGTFNYSDEMLLASLEMARNAVQINKVAQEATIHGSD